MESADGVTVLKAISEINGPVTMKKIVQHIAYQTGVSFWDKFFSFAENRFGDANVEYPYLFSRDFLK